MPIFRRVFFNNISFYNGFGPRKHARVIKKIKKIKKTNYVRPEIVKFSKDTIELGPDELISYCDNLIHLNKNFNINVPIFIKGFKLLNKQVVAVYLNSGIFREGHLENIFIKVTGEFLIDKLNVSSDDFEINIVRRKNVDYLVDYEINNDLLDVRNPFKQLVRFEYDSKISDVLLYSVSNFLQYSMFKNNIVRDIKKFLRRILMNTDINEYTKNPNVPITHRAIKRRILYPLLFLVLDIISFKYDKSDIEDYPEINIESLFNSCNSSVQKDTENIIFETVNIDELDDIKEYIKNSFNYLIDTPIETDSQLETILSQLHTFEIKLYEEAFGLYNKLVRSIEDQEICRLKIYSSPDDNRYRVVRYKLIENILFNQYVRSQLFNSYIFKNDIDYKCLKSTELLMFSEKGVSDTGDYDALYSRVSNKFYRQIHYLEDTQNQNIEREYTFRYIIE